MNFETLSHGQIHSKIWLCDILEPLLPEKPSVLILGAWYNVMGFIMLIRNPKRYAFIVGLDIDPTIKPLADKFCEAWTMSDSVRLRNDTGDANTVDYWGYNVVINSSVEHMIGNQWFENLKPNTIVCLQSSNLPIDNPNWDVSNANPTLETLKEKYPLSQILYEGEKPIQYENWGYKRFMIIGVK